jgi:hypothetical protein
MAPAHQQFLLGVHALMKASKMSELRMAENEDSVKSEINLADEIIAGRKCTNTKVQYGRKVEHFKKWISEVNPDCMSSDSTLNLHLIDTSQLQQFLGHICKKKNAKGEYLSPTVYQAFQHVSGYKSAIKDYYSTKNVKFSLESGRMMEHFFKGYNRKIAQMKQDGFIPLIEGKQPISFKGYKFLASKALDQLVDYNISISCHLFLVLCWNLIARCVSVGSLMYDHVSWSLDALVIVFPSHKSDKEGKNALPKHVFANASEPAICPILSFAIYLFTRGYDREGSKASLFSGEAESRFSKWLHKLCADNKEVLMNQGIEISMIGTHSFRKGVASYLSGTPGGPTSISIYLRAGWSLGPVLSRYIMEGEGSDQQCGRAAAGLPVTEVAFANLPPRFVSGDSGLTSNEWEDILPGYSTFYPKSFR